MIQTIYHSNRSAKVEVRNPNEHLQKHWVLGLFYEGAMLDFIRRNYPDGLMYVDAGACIGNHTLFFSEIMKGEVHAFEPMPEVFGHLARNVELNKPNKIRLNNIGLSNRFRELNFVQSDLSTNAGMSKAVFDGSGQKVTVLPLDKFNLKPDILKIDTEGMGLSVLNGAKHTIEQHKPEIFIECDTLQEFDVISSMLSGYGYKHSGHVFNATPTYHFTAK